MERYSYHALYETRGCGLLSSRLSNMSIPHLTILCHPSYNIKECRGFFFKQLRIKTGKTKSTTTQNDEYKINVLQQQNEKYKGGAKNTRYLLFIAH